MTINRIQRGAIIIAGRLRKELGYDVKIPERGQSIKF